jgi:hypothetical protein
MYYIIIEFIILPNVFPLHSYCIHSFLCTCIFTLKIIAKYIGSYTTFLKVRSPRFRMESVTLRPQSCKEREPGFQPKCGRFQSLCLVLFHCCALHYLSVQEPNGNSRYRGSQPVVNLTHSWMYEESKWYMFLCHFYLMSRRT